MDHTQLNSLARPEIQQLAKRECLKANLKSSEIIRLLLEKYPDGVPKCADKPSVPNRPTSTLPKAREPVRRSKRKSTAKLRAPSVKVEEINLNSPAEPTIDEPDTSPKRPYVRSLAPSPISPTWPFDPFRRSGRKPLPTTPRANIPFWPRAEGEIEKITGAHCVGRQPETNPATPEAADVTSHQVYEMLSGLTEIIDAASLDPKESSSIFYRAEALNTILDTAILPRMMKVDKDVKDIVWMRAALEKHMGPRLKEQEILPESRHGGVFNARSDLSFLAPRLPSPKRPREEGGNQGDPAQSCASKRTRVQ